MEQAIKQSPNKQKLQYNIKFQVSNLFFWHKRLKITLDRVVITTYDLGHITTGFNQNPEIGRTRIKFLQSLHKTV